MTDDRGEEYVGQPTSDVPKREPTTTACMGKRAKKDADGVSRFKGYCQNWPGKGTGHKGDGRCKFHDNQGSGEDNPQFKHGLFSEVIREEDKDTLRKIESMTTAAKLESTLNIQVMKLRRAIKGMESEERADFMEVFEAVVAGAAAPDGEISKDQLMYLARMLGQNDRAIREWADLIRKTAKDLHKITDGETVTVEHGFDGEELGELRDMAADLF